MMTREEFKAATEARLARFKANPPTLTAAQERELAREWHTYRWFIMGYDTPEAVAEAKVSFACGWCDRQGLLPH
jgi:hypothetical protein